MKVAYFDCAYGAAGDMLLGALVAAGLPIEAWLAELAKLDLPAGSFEIEISDTIRCSIAARKVDVHCLVNGTGQFAQTVHSHEHEHLHPHEYEHSHPHENEHEHPHPHEHEHSHPHEHEHSHSHEHEHSHSHSHEHNLNHEHERNLPEILRIIENSQISTRAKTVAAKIFSHLGAAEAKVHGMSIDQVHFHEVGAIDAIIDIVGFAIAYDLLSIEYSVVSALPVGTGLIKTRHGIYPVPGPAVISLMAQAQAPVAASTFSHECLTPTGAAILTTIADSYGSMPSMIIESCGYGAGTLNPAKFPNVCRAVIGTATSDPTEAVRVAASGAHGESSFESDVISVIEANIDDMSPQVLSFAMEQFLKNGALDVSITPIVMKKGRSGHLLSLICKPEDCTRLQESLLRHTTSIGVRTYQCERLVAVREWQEITIGHNKIIRVKVARDKHGNVINTQPEYEECASYATEYGVPLKEVIALALAKLTQR